MPEYGNAVEIMHTDKDWKIDPKEPLIWAPPCPADKVAMARRTLIDNFRRTRESGKCPELVDIIKIEFMHGPVDFYTEIIYELSEDGEILYYPPPRDEPIILDTIVHTNTWLYRFGWYVNTDAKTQPGRSGFTQGGWVTRKQDNREVIEVPL